MRKRSLAREMALQSLYQIEIRGQTTPAVIDDFLTSRTSDPQIQAFARELINGVLTRQDELDNALKPLLENWQMERLAMIDRIILRLGSYELLFSPETPPVVAINEAVDLAKKYSTKDSGGFVNGVLDKLNKKV